MSAVDSPVAKELAALGRIQDRILGTSDAELTGVLDSLLSKLLPLANTEGLFAKVSEIIHIVSKRLELSKPKLQLSKLISVVKPSAVSHGCDLAIASINTLLIHCSTSSRGFQYENPGHDCAAVLLDSMQSSVPFSASSNALCFYSLYVLEDFAKLLVTEKRRSKAASVVADVLGDYLLDVVLLQQALTKDAVGSVQAGLSAARVERLTACRNQWALPDINRLKKLIIDLVPLNFLSSAYSSALCIVCSCDLDSDVATQAVFKMNGAVHMFDAAEYVESVLRILLGLCAPLPSAQTSSSSSSSSSTFLTDSDIPIVLMHRSPLKIEAQCAILHWLQRYFSLHLMKAGKQVLAVAFKNIFSASSSMISSSSIRLISASMHLLMELSRNSTVSFLLEASIVFAQCCKKVLLSFLNTVSSFALIDEREVNMSVRSDCYRIIADISDRNPQFAAQQTDLVEVLFRLLEVEDIRICVALHEALHSLRTAFHKKHKSVQLQSDASVVITEETPTTSSSSSSSPSLEDLMVKSRKSSNPKTRLAALQWVRVLFGWEDISIRTIVLLSGDPSAAVSHNAINKLIFLRNTFFRCGTGNNRSDKDTMASHEMNKTRDSYGNAVSVLNKLMTIADEYKAVLLSQSTNPQNAEGQAVETNYSGSSVSHDQPSKLLIEQLIYTLHVGLKFCMDYCVTTRRMIAAGCGASKENNNQAQYFFFHNADVVDSAFDAGPPLDFALLASCCELFVAVKPSPVAFKYLLSGNGYSSDALIYHHSAVGVLQKEPLLSIHTAASESSTRGGERGGGGGGEGGPLRGNISYQKSSTSSDSNSSSSSTGCSQNALENASWRLYESAVGAAHSSVSLFLLYTSGNDGAGKGAGTANAAAAAHQFVKIRSVLLPPLLEWLSFPICSTRAMVAELVSYLTVTSCDINSISGTIRILNLKAAAAAAAAAAAVAEPSGDNTVAVMDGAAIGAVCGVAHMLNTITTVAAILHATPCTSSVQSVRPFILRMSQHSSFASELVAEAVRLCRSVRSLLSRLIKSAIDDDKSGASGASSSSSSALTKLPVVVALESLSLLTFNKECWTAASRATSQHVALWGAADEEYTAACTRIAAVEWGAAASNTNSNTNNNATTATTATASTADPVLLVSDFVYGLILPALDAHACVVIGGSGLVTGGTTTERISSGTSSTANVEALIRSGTKNGTSATNRSTRAESIVIVCAGLQTLSQLCVLSCDKSLKSVVLHALLQREQQPTAAAGTARHEEESSRNNNNNNRAWHAVGLLMQVEDYAIRFALAECVVAIIASSSISLSLCSIPSTSSSEKKQSSTSITDEYEHSRKFQKLGNAVDNNSQVGSDVLHVEGVNMVIVTENEQVEDDQSSIEMVLDLAEQSTATLLSHILSTPLPTITRAAANNTVGAVGESNTTGHSGTGNDLFLSSSSSASASNVDIESSNTNTIITSSRITTKSIMASQRAASMSTVLLVMMRRFTQSTIGDSLLSEAVLKRLLAIFINLLRDAASPYTQDMSCWSICYLYAFACSNTLDSSLREYVSSEVINALTREQKGTLPAGYHTAGETSRTNNSTNNSNNSTDNNSAGNGASNNNQQQQQQQQGGTGPAVAGGGGGGGMGAAQRSALELAAAAAAAELGMTAQLRADAEEAENANNNSSARGGGQAVFGIYAAVCKVAKKTGDSSVLFALLGMVMRDVSFGADPASALLKTRYAVRMQPMSPQSITLLLPMLYHSKYDPHTVVRGLMRQLWDSIFLDTDNSNSEEEVANSVAPLVTDSSGGSSSPPLPDSNGATNSNSASNNSSNSASDNSSSSSMERSLDLIMRYKDRVVRYCCDNLHSKSWRDREASCLALEALLPKLSWAFVAPYTSSLWTHGMNVLDDIRTSTRLAAVGFVKTLSDHMERATSVPSNTLPSSSWSSTRNSSAGASPGSNISSNNSNNSNNSSDGTSTSGLPEESRSADSASPKHSVVSVSSNTLQSVAVAVNLIVPLLLEKGVLESSAEARGVAVGTLVRVISAARSHLGQWLVPLISVLVESMSALEPKSLQYMQFHTARLQISDDELENMRVKLSQSSPMQEALDACLCALSISSSVSSSPSTASSPPSSQAVPLVKTANTGSISSGPTTNSAISSSSSGNSNENVPLLRTLGDRLSGDSVPAAAHVLCGHLTSGVGLATRVVAADSLSRLAEKFPAAFGGAASEDPSGLAAVMAGQVVTPFMSQEWKNCGRKVLTALTDSMLSSSHSLAASLRRAIVSALGATAKVVSAEVLSDICMQLTHKYNTLARDDLERSAMVGSCIQQIVSRVGDAITSNEVWKQLLLCTYMGCFDPDKEAQEVWFECFNQALNHSGTGTKLAAIRRMLADVCDAATSRMKELSWKRRLQGLAVLKDVLQNVPAAVLCNVEHEANSLPLGAPVVTTTITTTTAAAAATSSFYKAIVNLFLLLPGQIWSGQELAMETISEFFVKCRNVIFSSAAPNDCVLHLQFGAKVTESESGAHTLLLNVDNLQTRSATAATTLNIDKQQQELAMKGVVVEEESISKQIPSYAPDSAAALYGPYTDHPISALRVGATGLLSLLLLECERGPSAYRLHVAQAVSLFPWTAIKPAGSFASAAAAVATPVPATVITSVFANTVPLLMRHAGIGEIMERIEEEAASSLSSASALRPSASPVSDSSSSITSSTAVNSQTIGGSGSSYSNTTATITAVNANNSSGNKSRVSTRARNNASLFGSRYVGVAGAGKPTAATNNTTATRRTASSGSTTTRHASTVSAGGGVSSSTSTASVTPVTFDGQVVAVNASTADPAYRVKFIDTLCEGWLVEPTSSLTTTSSSIPPPSSTATTPGAAAVGPSSSSELSLVEHAVRIVRWARLTADSEVWSVRRSTVQLLGAVGKSTNLMQYIGTEAQQRSAAINNIGSTSSSTSIVEVKDLVLMDLLLALNSALKEVKYSKIRYEAAKSLEKVLDGVNMTRIKDSEALAGIVREMIRTAATDSQPNILETAATLQSLWIGPANSTSTF